MQIATIGAFGMIALRAKMQILLLPLLLIGACHRTDSVSSTPSRGFANAVDDFYWGYLDAWPTRAVSLGHHQYDGRLPDVSPAGLSKHRSWLRKTFREIERHDPTTLTPTQVVERDSIVQMLRGELFDMEVNRSPWRNPMVYHYPLGLVRYISRDYAPLAQRVRAIIAAANATEAYLGHARHNLETALPAPWIETALLQVNGLIVSVGEDGGVRRATAELEAGQKRELDEALDRMIDALKKQKAFLESLKANATDDYALGKERFLRMLKETQGVEIDLERLEAIGRQDLERNHAALERAARAIDPRKSLKEVVAMVVSDKPAANRVLALATEQSADLRRFLVDRQIVTIPSDDLAEVRETPPFMRWNAAFLDSAGPFEKEPLPSFYYISPPDPSWSKEKQEAYIPANTDLFYISVHELWPGHFLHTLHLKKRESKVLRSLWNYAMGEGWAHYTEEMMWEAGVAAGDERNHIGQLLNALLRNVRFVSAIGLHAKGMTIDESEAFFREKAFQDPGNARQQAVRGTFDPMYLSYTLGKLMILKLRDDWKEKMGDAYTLKGFHDRFLSYGAAPVPVIRKAMLGADAGPPL